MPELRTILIFVQDCEGYSAYRRSARACAYVLYAGTLTNLNGVANNSQFAGPTGAFEIALTRHPGGRGGKPRRSNDA